jgi:acyl-CoA reductase-like NAD-dependent aldehyde dehydrogenase
MTTTPTLIARETLPIGGEWVEPSAAGTIEVVGATTEEVIGRVPEGTADDVDRAVAAARAAFETWSQVPLADRVGLCTAVSIKLQERQEELTGLLAMEMGAPVSFGTMVQTGLPIMDFSSMAHLVDEIPWEQKIGNSLILREPIGVVGAITPWNYPLHQVSAKVAPAMVAGCTVVLKPSEVTPLSAFALAEIFEEVGVPGGVLNIVTGYGPVVGEAIAAHPGIDMVSFTGSTRAGRRVSEVASATVKKVALELGGKSPNVILDDADLERAVVNGLQKCFLNSGQTCSALTRMLVPRAVLPVVEQIAAAAAEQTVVGDPLDPGTDLGPLVSETQLERVRSYIARGVEEGAKLVTGGAEPPDGLDRGYYVRPTVFSEVTPEMTIAREEIFGPVLVIEPYEDEEDAIRIANDTDYGLAGGVYSGSEERAIAVARRIRTGQVEINGAAFNPLAPFGGYKQSGHGRELGPYGIEEFLALKSLQL